MRQQGTIGRAGNVEAFPVPGTDQDRINGGNDDPRIVDPGNRQVITRLERKIVQQGILTPSCIVNLMTLITDAAPVFMGIQIGGSIRGGGYITAAGCL